MKVSMHPHKIPGVYTLDYRPDGVKGRREREHVEGMAEALARKAALEGQPTGRDAVTFPRLADVVAEYLAWAEKNLAAATYYGKKRRLEKYIIPALGHYRVRELTQRMLDSYAQTLTTATTLVDLRHLKAMIGWMVKRRYAEPLKWVPEMPKYHPLIKPIPSQAVDILRVINALPVERHRVAATLMLLTGLRWNEVSHLRWEHYRDGAILLTVSKTHQSEIITLPEICIEWFERNKKAEGYVFSAPQKNTPPTAINGAMLKASKEVGVKMSPHMFRHASATYLYDLTEDIYAVQHHLRHSRVATTEIYTRYSAVRRKGAVNILANAFKVDKTKSD